MDLTIPRETSEFVPIPVFDDNEEITDFETAVTRWPARPSVWSPAVVSGTEHGVAVAGLTHGQWQVWVRVSGTIIAVGSIWVE